MFFYNTITGYKNSKAEVPKPGNAITSSFQELEATSSSEDTDLQDSLGIDKLSPSVPTNPAPSTESSNLENQPKLDLLEIKSSDEYTSFTGRIDMNGLTGSKSNSNSPTSTPSPTAASVKNLSIKGINSNNSLRSETSQTNGTYKYNNLNEITVPNAAPKDSQECSISATNTIILESPGNLVEIATTPALERASDEKSKLLKESDSSKKITNQSQIQSLSHETEDSSNEIQALTTSPSHKAHNRTGTFFSLGLWKWKGSSSNIEIDHNDARYTNHISQSKDKLSKQESVPRQHISDSLNIPIGEPSEARPLSSPKKESTSSQSHQTPALSGLLEKNLQQKLSSPLLSTESRVAPEEFISNNIDHDADMQVLLSGTQTHTNNNSTDTGKSGKPGETAYVADNIADQASKSSWFWWNSTVKSNTQFSSTSNKDPSMDLANSAAANQNISVDTDLKVNLDKTDDSNQDQLLDVDIVDTTPKNDQLLKSSHNYKLAPSENYNKGQTIHIESSEPTGSRPAAETEMNIMAETEALESDHTSKYLAEKVPEIDGQLLEARGWSRYFYGSYGSKASSSQQKTENALNSLPNKTPLQDNRGDHDLYHTTKKHKQTASGSSANYKITESGIVYSSHEILGTDERKYSVSGTKNPTVCKSSSIVEPKLNFDEVYGYSSNSRTGSTSNNKPGLVNNLKNAIYSCLGFSHDHEPEIHSNANIYRSMSNLSMNNIRNSSATDEQIPLLVNQNTNQYKLDAERSIHNSAVSVNKIVVIGVHGWFPTRLLQMVAGEPTGTSEKFCEKMKLSVLEYLQKEHGVDFDEKNIVLMPLVAQGTIENRVEASLAQLLDFDDEQGGDEESLSSNNPEDERFIPENIDPDLSNTNSSRAGADSPVKLKTSERNSKASTKASTLNHGSNTKKYLENVLKQNEANNSEASKDSKDSKKPNSTGTSNNSKNASKKLPIDINVPRKRDRRKLIEKADTILVVTHSQGTPVSALLLERLIELDIVRPRLQRVGMLAMAGINHGPFPAFRDNVIVKYVEHDAARELFFFTDPSSSIVTQYIAAVGAILQKGVRLLYVASWVDEVVPFYSALLHAVSHPNLYRAVCITHPLKPSFLTNLAIFAIKLRNAGIGDFGLSIHLSDAIAGSIWPGSVSGHSSIYEESQVYKLALRWMFFSCSSMPPYVNLQEQYTQPLISFKPSFLATSTLKRKYFGMSSAERPGQSPSLSSNVLGNHNNNSFDQDQRANDDRYSWIGVFYISSAVRYIAESLTSTIYNKCGIHPLRNLFSCSTCRSANELSDDDDEDIREPNAFFRRSGKSHYGSVSQSPHIVYHPFNPNEQLNPYFLPWIIKTIWESNVVNSNPALVQEIKSLAEQYDEWVPESKAEKDLKYKLEPLRSFY